MPTTQTNRNASAPRQPSEWDNRKLGCMWKRTKKGTNEPYLTGVLDIQKLKALVASATGDIQLVGFSNKHKKEEKHPDVIIYLSEKRDEGGTAAPKSAPAAATDPNASDLI